MNYVNFENSKALKEMGFDEPVNTYFFHGELTHSILYKRRNKKEYYAAPDFLTAADWLVEKWKSITNKDFYIEFHNQNDISAATVYENLGHRVFNNHRYDDHRNKAIAYAIQKIKEQHEALTKPLPPKDTGATAD